MLCRSLFFRCVVGFPDCVVGKGGCAVWWCPVKIVRSGVFQLFIIKYSKSFEYTGERYALTQGIIFKIYDHEKYI